jgi:hypothetical protein
MPIEQGRPSTPGPARANTTPNGPAQVRLVSTAEKLAAFHAGTGMFDVDTNGDLTEPARVLIFGWKTNDENEEPTRVEALTPPEAGRAFADLLSDGHVHFTASRLGLDGRVAYPS